MLNGGKLIATHEGRYFQTSNGLALGPGMFVKGLEYAADCTAHVVGKPSSDFFRGALDNTDRSFRSSNDWRCKLFFYLILSIRTLKQSADFCMDKMSILREG